MMKNLVELFKEGFLMYSDSLHGDTSWRAKRNETSKIDSSSKNVYQTKKLHVAN
jgi:hypothetical protein